MARLRKPDRRLGQQQLFYTGKKPWRAEVRHNYKSRYLGDFPTKEEAEGVERAMRTKLTGRPDTVPGWEKGRIDVAS